MLGYLTDFPFPRDSGLRARFATFRFECSGLSRPCQGCEHGTYAGNTTLDKDGSSVSGCKGFGGRHNRRVPVLVLSSFYY